MVSVSDWFLYLRLAFKEVFSKRKNVTWVFLLALGFLTLNFFLLEYLQVGWVFLSDVEVFFSAYAYSLLSMPWYSLLFLVLLSLLSSILLVMLFYGYKKNVLESHSRGSAGAASSSGVLLSILAPACPSCGIGVLSVVGFGSVGAALPLGGQEIGLLGILVLGVSILFVSKQIAAPHCKVDFGNRGSLKRKGQKRQKR